MTFSLGTELEAKNNMSYVLRIALQATGHELSERLRKRALQRGRWVLGNQE